MPKPASKDASGLASPDDARPTETTQPQTTRFEAWRPLQISRTAIRNADYNPRQITEQAKMRLRDAIRRVGLVQPIVWNERTGNIVGGHQRIHQLDTLEGRRDYLLTVAAVNVDENRERELNVLLNNPETQGDWDLEKLKVILDTEGVQLENTGFGLADVMHLFGETPQRDTSIQKEIADSLAKIKSAYEHLSELGKTKDDMDYFCVVVFPGMDARKAFTDALGLPDNRYVNGDFLMARLRGEVALAEPEKPEPAGEGEGTVEQAGAGEHEAEGAAEPA